MKRSLVSLSLVSALSLVSLSIAFAGDPPAAAEKPGAAEAKPASPTTPAAAQTEADLRLERIKKLAGAWESKDEDGDGKGDVQVFYRVVSGGSAVAEFLMVGTPHEMVSMYHKDGDSLILTHYCSLGNQPRMRSIAGGKADEIAFDFIDGTNMKSEKDPHIHALTLTFVDDDHINAAWRSHSDGKPNDHSPTFQLTRVKDTAAAAKIAGLMAGPGTSLAGHKPE